MLRPVRAMSRAPGTDTYTHTHTHDSTYETRVKVKVEAAIGTDQFGQTLGAAGSRQNAEKNFGDAEDGFWRVDSNAVVRCQSNLLVTSSVVTNTF